MLGGAGLPLIAVLYRALVAVALDEEGARVAGLPVGTLNVVLAGLAGVTIALSMRIVGILLIAALMVLPVTAAGRLARSVASTFVLLDGDRARLGLRRADASRTTPTSPPAARSCSSPRARTSSPPRPRACAARPRDRTRRRTAGAAATYPPSSSTIWACLVSRIVPRVARPPAAADEREHPAAEAGQPPRAERLAPEAERRRRSVNRVPALTSITPVGSSVRAA